MLPPFPKHPMPDTKKPASTEREAAIEGERAESAEG